MTTGRSITHGAMKLFTEGKRWPVDPTIMRPYVYNFGVGKGLNQANMALYYD